MTHVSVVLTVKITMLVQERVIHVTLAYANVALVISVLVQQIHVFLGRVNVVLIIHIADIMDVLAQRIVVCRGRVNVVWTQIMMNMPGVLTAILAIRENVNVARRVNVQLDKNVQMDNANVLSLQDAHLRTQIHAIMVYVNVAHQNHVLVGRTRVITTPFVVNVVIMSNVRLAQLVFREHAWVCILHMGLWAKYK